MKKRIVVILLGINLFIFPNKALAQEWFYPMDHYFQRQSVKGFGTLMTDEFYKGKEKLFPFNRFYVFHAAVDLEVTDEEKEQNVPIYAVGAGPIMYIGTLAGYGGVMLQKLTSENTTALYGHVQITDLPIQVSDISVKPGQRITYLGNAFSNETSKERKHLHFGIYKGTDVYFTGHEATLQQLNTKWENPSTYLQSKGAKDPTSHVPTKAPVTIKDQPLEENIGFLSAMLQWAMSLFRHE